MIHQALFTQYANNYDLLRLKALPAGKGATETSILRLIRIADTRVRLALGMTINLDTHYTRAQTERVRDTYKIMIIINEAWFAFEITSELCKIANVALPTARPLNLIPDHKTPQVGLDVVLNQCNTEILTEISAKQIRHDKISMFIDFLANHAELKTYLKNEIQVAKNHFDSRKPLSNTHLLSLTYGIRNLWVHEGLLAGTGTPDYTVKIRLYKILFGYLVNMQVALINYIITEELKKY